MFIAIAMMCVFSSCSQEEFFQNLQSTDRTTLNIKEFVSSQRKIIGSAKTRAGVSLSPEQAKQIAISLDSATVEYYVQNIEPIAKTTPVLNIREEERELMSVDADIFLSHIQNNYSAAVYNIISNQIVNGGASGQSSTDLYAEILENGDALEQFVAAVAIVENDYNDILLDAESSYNQNSQNTRDQQKRMCDAQYEIDMQACSFSLWEATIRVVEAAIACGSLGAILGGEVGGAVLSVPTATVGGALGGAGGAIGEGYNQYNAYQEKQRCKQAAAQKRAACINAIK